MDPGLLCMQHETSAINSEQTASIPIAVYSELTHFAIQSIWHTFLCCRKHVCQILSEHVNSKMLCTQWTFKGATKLLYGPRRDQVWFRGFWQRET